MKVSSREFLRHFARMKMAAKTGEPVFVTSGSAEFVFQAVEKRSWQGALKGKARIVGNLLSTGSEWSTNSR
jgi:hypothetical protein